MLSRNVKARIGWNKIHRAQPKKQAEAEYALTTVFWEELEAAGAGLFGEWNPQAKALERAADAALDKLTRKHGKVCFTPPKEK